MRIDVNHWIRSSKEIDGCLDFDQALEDPTHPDRIKPEFDAGDHAHANDAGERAMLAAIDVGLFH